MITSTFICIPAAQINFNSRLIPVTGKDELDKLICSQHIGLHSNNNNNLIHSYIDRFYISEM